MRSNPIIDFMEIPTCVFDPLLSTSSVLKLTMTLQSVQRCKKIRVEDWRSKGGGSVRCRWKCKGNAMEIANGYARRRGRQQGGVGLNTNSVTR